MSIPVLPHRRDLRQGDLVFPEEILRIGHTLDFQFDSVSKEVQQEVFGPELDTSPLCDWLNLHTAYDFALQDVVDHIEITLCRNFGEEEHPFTYPLNRAERDVLRGEMEACCQLRTGRTLAQHYNHLLVQEEVPAELYQEFLEDIVSEIDRENRIITDLLTLVKMDKKVSGLNIAAVNINDLTELILKRLRPIARKKDVEVVFESVRPVTAEVDEVKMTLVMSNLVENAIKYNKEHGWVKVVLDADHQYFTFEVSDSGMGIPEDCLTQIYERFYRVEKSHSREIGGTGPGLAITKNAVLMHRGSITVTSTEGEGSTFLVKIPLNYIAQ